MSSERDADAAALRLIHDTAERVRAGGIPDILNRWLTMTPDSLVEMENRLERYRRLNRGEREMTTMANGAATVSLSTIAETGTLDAKTNLAAQVKKDAAAAAAKPAEKGKDEPPAKPSGKAGSKESATRALREAAAPPSSADKPKPAAASTRTRKPHAADAGDLKLIAQAVSFNIRLFHAGEWEEKTGLETLAAARERGLAMEASRKATRKAMIYAVLADGRTVLVPSTYNAPTTEQESAMETKTTKTAKAVKPAKAAKTTKRDESKDNARKAVKGPTTKGGKTKAEIIQDLLLRKDGATREQLSAATAYPHVNLKMAADRAEKTLGCKVKLVCLDKDAGRFKLEKVEK